MKVQIDISEEDAAAILQDYHYRSPLHEIIQDLARDAAEKFRVAFPKANPLPEFQRRMSSEIETSKSA